jgi:hypothetical protein
MNRAGAMDGRIALKTRRRTVFSDGEIHRKFLKSSRDGRFYSVMKQITLIKIERSVGAIDPEDFLDDRSLTEVIFSSNSHLREISGFQRW